MVLLFLASAQAFVVATSSPHATNAAKEVLAAGGNAFDAACAATFVLGVSQPYFTGIGGGGIAILAPKGEEPVFLDFRERAPKGVTAGPTDPKARNTGAWSVGIPGNVEGCGVIIKRWGAVTWVATLAPAIRLAERGFRVSQLFHEEITEQWGRFDLLGGIVPTRALFGGSSKKGLKKGEVLLQPGLAHTLRTLSVGGARSFYEGALAKSWTQEARSLGVNFAEAELAQFRAVEGKPARFVWGSKLGLTAALPSRAKERVGGVLNSIDSWEQKNGRPTARSPERYVGQARAMSAVIDGSAKASHTAHVSVVDDLGNAAAVTSSVGDVFGSGISLGQHGFVLNNTLADFNPDPGHPNAPREGAAPLSNMSPTLVYEGDKATADRLIAVVGAAGGPLIPQAVTQFLKNFYDYRLSAREAVRAPRVTLSDSGAVSLEKAAGPRAVAALEKAGFSVETVDTIWAVFQGAVRRSSIAPWEGVSDTRYDGLAQASASRKR